MLKYIYPQIEWDSIRYVGFDLDGTLYDEADFISQVYLRISEYLSKIMGVSQCSIYSSIFSRWLVKGSSYNHIFEDFLKSYNFYDGDINYIVGELLEIFRSYHPNIDICPRVERLLNEFSEHYAMFLVTDGNAALQSRKIVSLELDRWFSESNIGITNKFGSGYAKPSANIINKIELLNNDILPEQVVFFGDRSCDLEFSKNAGFCFIHVNNMINIDKSL